MRLLRGPVELQFSQPPTCKTKGLARAAFHTGCCLF